MTLLDFWASWCEPCRKENPENVAIYNEFKTKGFSIVGYSLDVDITNWRKAIIKDKLTWIHLSNFKKWDDDVVTIYGVNEIPATFLINQNGIIIAKNIRGNTLRKKLKELLD